MSKINIEYGLIKTFCPSAETVACSDEKCPKSVSFMKECFLADKLKDTKEKRQSKENS
jgi:hypothetical protein